MRSNYKQLGQYISEVNVKNTNLEVDLLLGVSITKKFIPSIANTIGTDMSKYKVVRKNQFGYGPITSRNGDKISVALLTEEQCIISTSYRVFEIKDHEELDPEYLMMWFRRPEFDRYARFMSHGSTREAFDWDEMCETELPVPSIKKQREIVKEYNTVANRIKLNEQLNQKLEETAQALYKHWFVDFEFPNENGQPYKSSGGEMVYNEELDQEIPVGWNNHKLDTLYKFQYGKGNVNPDNGGNYPVYGSNGIIGGFNEFNSEDAPVIGHIGANCGSVVYGYGKHFVTYNGVICKIKEGYDKYFGYVTLLGIDLQSETRGSSQPFVSYDMLYDFDIVLSNTGFNEKITSLLNPIFDRIISNTKEIQNLKKLSSIVLARLSLVESSKIEQFL